MPFPRFDLILICAVLTVASLVVGCGPQAVKPKDSADVKRQRDEQQQAEQKEPPSVQFKIKSPSGHEVADDTDLVVTPDEVFRSYVDDAEAAAAKYDGKTARITGRVRGFSVARLGAPHQPGIVLVDENSNSMVWCIAKNEHPWDEVGVEDTVTIRGVVSVTRDWGLWIDPYVLESTSGGPLAEYSADDLLRRYAADAEALKKELDDRWILVTGEIASIDPPPEFGALGLRYVYLKGEDGDAFPVGYSRIANKFDWIQPGMQVLMFGQVSFGEEPEQKPFELIDAEPLTLPR